MFKPIQAYYYKAHLRLIIDSFKGCGVDKKDNCPLHPINKTCCAGATDRTWREGIFVWEGLRNAKLVHQVLKILLAVAFFQQNSDIY